MIKCFIRLINPLLFGTIAALFLSLPGQLDAIQRLLPSRAVFAVGPKTHAKLFFVPLYFLMGCLKGNTTTGNTHNSPNML